MKSLLVLGALLLSVSSYAASNGKSVEMPSNGKASEVETTSDKRFCKWYENDWSTATDMVDSSEKSGGKRILYKAGDAVATVAVGTFCVLWTPLSLAEDVCRKMNDGEACKAYKRCDHPNCEK